MLDAGPPDGVRLAWHPALQDVLAVAAGTRVLLVALDDLGPPTNGPVRAGCNAVLSQNKQMSVCASSIRRGGWRLHDMPGLRVLAASACPCV